MKFISVQICSVFVIVRVIVVFMGIVNICGWSIRRPVGVRVLRFDKPD